MVSLQNIRVLVIETVDEFPNYDRNLFVEIGEIFSCDVKNQSVREHVMFAKELKVSGLSLSDRNLMVELLSDDL